MSSNSTRPQLKRQMENSRLNFLNLLFFPSLFLFQALNSKIIILKNGKNSKGRGESRDPERSAFTDQRASLSGAYNLNLNTKSGRGIPK